MWVAARDEVGRRRLDGGSGVRALDRLGRGRRLVPHQPAVRHATVADGVDRRRAPLLESPRYRGRSGAWRAALLAAAYLAYVIVRVVWECWNRADVDVLFSRRALVTGRSGGPSGRPFFAFCAVAAAFAAIGVSVLLAPFWSVIGYLPRRRPRADLVIGLLLSAMVREHIDTQDKRAREAASQSTVVRFEEVPSFELSSAAPTPRDIPKQPRNMAGGKDRKEDKS